MNGTEWIQIYSAANQLEAYSLKGMLESASIAVRLSGESLGSAAGELPANVVEVGLWVPAHQRQQAQHLLQSYENAQDEHWQCRHCGENNDGSFEICWRCGRDK